MSLLVPSYKTGYARNAGKSENPGLWDDLRGLWVPALGPTGLTLRDVSGHKNDGTLTLMAPATDWVMSEKGWVLDYDGANTYVDCGDADDFSFGNGTRDWPFSVSALVNMRDATNFTGAAKYTSVGGLEWRFSTDGADKWLFLMYDTSVNKFIARLTDALTGRENDWMHVVGVYDGSSVLAGISIYIDGVRADTADWTAAPYVAMEPLNQSVRIGRILSAESNGQIGPVSLYGRILAHSEIQQLYADPFAALQPRSRAFAAAAGLSIPIAMHHYNMMAV